MRLAICLVANFLAKMKWLVSDGTRLRHIMNVLLFRNQKSDQGTFGIIVFDGQYLYTGELPWKDNKPNISCIPYGIYSVQMRVSPKYGRVYEITVAGRTYILFHQGNFCGDHSLGFRTHVQGCVLLGFKRGKLCGQRAVLASRLARNRFESVMKFEPFTLEIKDVA